MKIGVGVTTFERPGPLLTCLTSIERHLGDLVDVVVVHDDCTVTPEYARQLRGYPHRFPSAQWLWGTPNRGVAVAKNRLLATMLAAGCDWLFLVEDDVEILDPRAVTGYIEACEASGLGHLNYHCPELHSNVQPREVDGAISLWPDLGGVFQVFSRRALLACGLLDEEFRNAWEHIEHTMRLALAGYATKHRERGNADATGSPDWVRLHTMETAGGSRFTEEGMASIGAQAEAWLERRPETYRLVFPG